MTSLAQRADIEAERDLAQLNKAAPKKEELPKLAAPETLPAGLPNVEPFEPGLLPETLQARCMDIADRLQCAPDFPAVGMMVALGSVIGRSVGIYPRRRNDWLVVPNLWGCVVGRPSVLKSPALDEATAPLVKLEIEARKQHDKDKAEYAITEAMAELRKDDAKKKAKAAMQKGDEAKAKALLSGGDGESTPPTRRRFKTNDATVEKLGELLAENPRGVLMFRDELSGWMRGLDKTGREGEREFYLEAFNGTGSYTFDRIGRGTIDIESNTVSVLGGTQPGKLKQYVKQTTSGGMYDDGLMQRFQLLVWPDVQTWKDVDRWPDNEAKRQAQEVFQYLADLTAEQVGAELDEYGSIPALRFSEGGQAVFDDFYSDLMQRVRSGEMPEYLEAHLGKYASLMPSLALVIHLAEYGTGAVSESAAIRAAAWCQYLESHARRMYAPGLLGDVLAARALADKIKRGKIGNQFTERELYRKCWAGLSDKDEVRGAITTLAEYDWLTIEDTATGGRPTTVCTVNPRISGVAL